MMAFRVNFINLKSRKCSQQSKLHRTLQIMTLTTNMVLCHELGDGAKRRLTAKMQLVCRANELKLLNQGLLRYPGMGNLVRDLEQVGSNVRHA